MTKKSAKKAFSRAETLRAEAEYLANIERYLPQLPGYRMRPFIDRNVKPKVSLCCTSSTYTVWMSPNERRELTYVTGYGWML